MSTTRGDTLYRDWLASGLTQADFCAARGISRSTLCNAQQRAKVQGFNRLPESTYPRYNKPLESEGDALILPDVEAPFHHADFVNRCIELAIAWDVRLCIMAGDAVHFDVLSRWEPAWTGPGKANSRLTEDDEKEFLAFAAEMSGAAKERYMTKVMGLERANPCADEISQAKSLLKVLGGEFYRVDYLLGNHEGRFLAAMNTPTSVTTLGDVLGLDSKFRISPYYYSILNTSGGKYMIEHPKGAGDITASKLANKLDCHIIMAHSHWWDKRRSDSGRWWAIHAGCCVDEERLPYASQRHTANHAHALGAVIVRDGYPWLLGQDTPWEMLKKCR